MSSSIDFLATWAPSTIPTTTVLTTVAATALTELQVTLASAALAIATATELESLVSLSRDIRGAQASMTIIQNQQILSTATAAAIQASASQAIFDATLNLAELQIEMSPYDYNVIMSANAVFAGIFGFVTLFHLGYMVWLKNWYFGVCFICGSALEFVGYLGRTLSGNDPTEINYFLIQIITLTIAPAFIMAGIYYLLGKLIVVHGRDFSILRPTWYSYMFVTCDLISLILQGVGGGMAATASQQLADTSPGTHVMLAGIGFQVFSMSVFLYFWFDFLFRINFGVNPSYKFKIVHVFKIFGFTQSTKQWKDDFLEGYYEDKYRHLRNGKYFLYFPLVVTASTLFVFVRCIYRVLELAQGWNGFLITHEMYILILDALMVAIACIILTVFHPFLFIGRDESLPLRSTKVVDESLISEPYAEKNEEEDFR